MKVLFFQQWAGLSHKSPTTDLKKLREKLQRELKAHRLELKERKAHVARLITANETQEKVCSDLEKMLEVIDKGISSC